MSMICGPIWRKTLGGINEETSGGIRCVYDWWAHVCCNASQHLPIPSELRELEISGNNSFFVVIFCNQG